MKRQWGVLLAVLALLATAGCVGLVFGEDLEMDGEPAGVSDEALAETDFTFAEHRTVYLNESFDVGGQTRSVNATNHLTVYDRTTSLDRFDRDVGGFVVVSTPDVSIAGQSVNPVARLSHREIVDRFRGDLESEVGAFGNLSSVSEQTEPVLGYAADISTFETETTIEDRNVTLYVHVTTVKHEGDMIVGIGVHPEALAQQGPEIHRLLRGIEHPFSV